MRTNLETALTTLITADWGNRTFGDLDSPSGIITLIDATTERDMLASILGELDYDGAPTIDDVPASWFIVREFDDGTVTALDVGPGEYAATEQYRNAIDRFR